MELLYCDIRFKWHLGPTISYGWAYRLRKKQWHRSSLATGQHSRVKGFPVSHAAIAFQLSHANLTVCFGAACSFKERENIYSNVQNPNTWRCFLKKKNTDSTTWADTVKTKKQHAAYSALRTSNNLKTGFNWISVDLR